MARERWLITGASGQLGSHCLHQLAACGEECETLALTGAHAVGIAGVQVARADLADADSLQRRVADFAPSYILHTAAMSAVGECYARPEQAERINTDATAVLADAAGECGARLVFTSTDMVFGGDAAPYRESDPPRPLSCYARTKLAAERKLADRQDVVIARLPLMYGFPLNGRETTFVRQMTDLRRGTTLRLFADEFRTPVWLADAARALIGLARSGFSGLIHVAGPQRLSRYDLVARCAELLRVKEPRLLPTSRLEIDAAEPRAADLSLDGSRLAGLFPSLRPGPVRAEVFAGA